MPLVPYRASRLLTPDDCAIYSVAESESAWRDLVQSIYRSGSVDVSAALIDPFNRETTLIRLPLMAAETGRAPSGALRIERLVDNQAVADRIRIGNVRGSGASYGARGDLLGLRQSFGRRAQASQVRAMLGCFLLRQRMPGRALA
jgi:hypothetical protein